MTKTKVEIDTRTFVRFWLVLIGIGLVIALIYKTLTGLIMIGIAIFLTLALRPLRRKLQKLFNNKTAATIVAFSVVVVFIVVIILIVGPVVVNETAKFIAQFPEMFESKMGGWDGINRLGQNLGIDNLQGEIYRNLSNLSQDIINNVAPTVASGVGSVADTITKILLILVLTLLFSLEGGKIMEKFWQIVGSRKEDRKPTTVVRNVIERMCNVVSTYVSHQFLVALIDGCATTLFVFVLSLIFQFDSVLAIPMGLISFVLYLIPMFGQFIGACIVTLVLAFSNPIAAVVFVVLYVVWIQIENNLIAPKIQGQAMHLPPVIILCATVIGMFSFGLLGAIIAIPIAGCVRVFIEEYPNLKSLRE